MKESETILDIIKRRRSVMHFDGRILPDKHIEQILEAGRWAPSGANAQPWCFILMTKRETLAAIAGTNMTLMATALGIGSCWIGAFEEPDP